MSAPVLTLKYERGRKTWVAAIVDELARDNVVAQRRTISNAVYVLEPDRLYEVWELDKIRYVVPVDGEIKELTEKQVLELLRLAELERTKQREMN